MKKSLLRIAALMLAVPVMINLVGCDGEDEPKVLGELEAKIDVSAINFVSDLQSIDGRRIKAGQTVTLSDKSEGEPDSWSWTFEGGPTTVSTKNATVSWADAVGQVKVTLNVTRADDGATDTDELILQVGPVEKLDRVVFGMEDKSSTVKAAPKWYSWSPNLGENYHQLDATGGANGTTQSLKVVLPSNYGEFQLRTHEYNFGNNAVLESNKDYVFSYYIKASEPITLSESSFLNNGGEPAQSWWTPTWNQSISVTTNWTKKTFEFNTGDISTLGDTYKNGTANNAGPFFKHFASLSGSNVTIWIDEISLKEKEK